MLALLASPPISQQKKQSLLSFHIHSTFPCYTTPKGGGLMATLLIVEDDRKTNDAICEYLKPAGHKVIPAYDGGEALQLFRQNSIDLVVWSIEPPCVGHYAAPCQRSVHFA